jgi:hypothetical protein
MQQSAEMPVQGYVLIGLIVLVVLFFRIRGMSRKRPLNVNTLWVIPAVFVGIAALNFYQYPPTWADAPWLAVAFLLGAALGWQRGRLMKIWAEPDGQLMMQGTPWAILFLVALIALRAALRSGLEMEAEEWAISPALINDGFIVFALGLFGVMRVEMWVRAVRLRREHAAGAS